jgi:hypothetical protein
MKKYKIEILWPEIYKIYTTYEALDKNVTVGAAMTCNEGVRDWVRNSMLDILILVRIETRQWK